MGAGAGTPAAWTEADVDAMRHAVRLAWRGAGRTETNPIVGSVVVADGVTVGAGFHREDGIAHAEIVALQRAGARARGATLYASLEPCVHYGKTPPCVDRIIESGIARVVVATLDPDPRVRGRGVDMLRAAGIRVDVGCLGGSALLDTLGYYRDRLGLGGTVTLKAAVSSDGMVARASGRRDDVTGEAARRDVHALRALHDAVIVGIETALVDRPRLDCRLLDPRPAADPVPVVLDSNLRLPATNPWSDAGREYLVIARAGADASRASALEASGGRVVWCPAGPGGVDVAAALAELRARGLARVLVEGGPRVLASFHASNQWDALWVYRSPAVFGSAGVPLSPLPGRECDVSTVGDDERRRFVNAERFDAMLDRLDALLGE